MGVIENLPMIIPPIEEQQAIASFLDRKTAELDELIRLKEQQIELLCVKRQALISYAVTRGLDPSVKLRPSGLEWLGEIPAHWELLRLKFCLCSIEQGWSPSCENRMAEPDEWGVLKVGCVNGTSFNQSENKALPSNLEPLIEYEIKDGDVLVSRANTRELLGSASVVENVRPRLLLCDKLYRLNLKAEVLNNHFLVFYLGGSVARHQIERDATGASDSMQNIGQDTVRNLWLPIPPIEEQLVIVDHIRLETSQIDIVVKTIRSQIDQLREYRHALISAAVTGKIDVRGVSV
jgi:type I restriction enzyme S subunit